MSRTIQYIYYTYMFIWSRESFRKNYPLSVTLCINQFDLANIFLILSRILCIDVFFLRLFVGMAGLIFSLDIISWVILVWFSELFTKSFIFVKKFRYSGKSWHLFSMVKVPAVHCKMKWLRTVYPHVHTVHLPPFPAVMRLTSNLVPRRCAQC